MIADKISLIKCLSLTTDKSNMDVLHLVTLTVAELLLFGLLSKGITFTAASEGLISKSQCFDTVKHYYINPRITGDRMLIYSFQNDDFEQRNFSMNCQSSDLFVEILSITLSLPSYYNASYCVESQTTNYNVCKKSKQCNCCKKPKDRCFNVIDVKEYAKGCYLLQNCTITVRSKFLVNCPGRMYNCAKKKCHSRWVEVNYTCQHKDDVRRFSVTSEGDYILIFTFAKRYICYSKYATSVNMHIY